MNMAPFAGLLLIAGSSAHAGDGLCHRLERFEKQAQPSDGGADWFEVYWAVDPNAEQSVGCKHRSGPAAKELCSWLPRHMSMEFPGILPGRISSCYGLDAGRYAADKFPYASIKFTSRLGNRLILQTGQIDGMPWMRLAVSPGGSDASLDALPNPTGYEE